MSRHPSNPRVLVLDPGHGGRDRLGSSTPIGVRGPRGLAEKDVTLRVAQAMARYVPDAVLTRNDDRNLSLAERVQVVRDAGARTFVSLHANGGGGAPHRRGAEVWIHPRSSDGSRALGTRVLQELERATPGGATLRAGELAVIDPAHLGDDIDACLVELDYLSDPEGERRLGDPTEIDRIARVLAGALGAAPAHRGGRARTGWSRGLGDGQGAGQGGGIGGDADGDLDAGAADADVDAGIDGAIPDDLAIQAQSLAFPGARRWPRPRALDTPTPDYAQAARFVAAGAGHFTVPARPRTISRIVIHITDGTTTNGTVSWFQSSQNVVSAHYVVGQDGEVVQMVREADIAHHAHGANRDGIGIEHVALSPAGARSLSARSGRTIQPLYPSDRQYRASAALVADLCRRYGIPADRQHILGHAEVDTGTTHADCPNSVWDWNTYMSYVSAALAPASTTTSPGGTTTSPSDYGPGDYPAPPRDYAYGRR